MPQKSVTFKAQGLYTYPNQFSAPEGAFSDCLEVFCDRPGVVENARRRVTYQTPTLDSTYTGFDLSFPILQGVGSTSPFTNTASTLTQQFKPEINNHGYAGQLVNVTSTTSANWGTPGSRVKSVFEANNNIFCAQGGAIGSDLEQNAHANGALIRYTSDNTFLARGCGMPEAPVPGWSIDITNYGIGTFPTPIDGATWGMDIDGSDPMQRAYRVLFLYKDANGNLIRGAPSGRLLVYHPVDDFNVIVFGPGTCSAGLAIGDIVQLYASEITPAGPDEPSDDMRLVYEHIVTSTDITNKWIAIQDQSPDDWRGEALYTNDTEDGIAMAEQPPPPAAHAKYFKNVAWYAGVSWPGYSSVVLNFLGIDAVQTGGSATTLDIFGLFTLTAVTSEDITAGHFLAASWYGTPAQNLAEMCKSICRCVNYLSAGNVLAVYATPPGATSETIIFKYFGVAPLGVSGNANGMQSSCLWPQTASITATNLVSGTPFTSPVLPVTSTYPQTGARLYFSKEEQPEAVPEDNYVTVGSPAVPITGLAYLRDSMFVFKPEGLFRVTGTDASSIKVESFDATVRMYGSMFTSIAAGGNQIFALCNQGVVSITETGVKIISHQIENLIRPFQNAPQPLAGPGQPIHSAPRWVVSGVASETERKYFLQVGMTTSNCAVYCYNFIENTWAKIAPVDTSHSSCLVVNSPQESNCQDYVLFNDTNSATIKTLVRADNPDSVSGPNSDSATWTYSLCPGGDSTELKRFYSVKVVILGSTTTSPFSITFTSDTGATSTTVTPTVYNNTTINVQVPQAHALCGRLTLQLNGPTSGGSGVGSFMVSEVKATYDYAGEWTVK